MGNRKGNGVKIFDKEHIEYMSNMTNRFYTRKDAYEYFLEKFPKDGITENEFLNKWGTIGNRLKKKWDKESIVEYISKIYNELGYIPKRAYFEQKVENRPTRDDIEREFGSFRGISKELNFISEELYNKKMKTKRLAEESLLEIERMKNELGHLPYVKYYNKNKVRGMTQPRLEKALGLLWSEILVQYFDKPATNFKYDDIVNAVLELKTIQNTILLKDVANLLGISESGIVSILGGTPFCDILTECGVRINKKSNKQKLEEDMLFDFKNLYNELGRIPILDDIANRNMATYATYISKFGSIENVCIELKIEYDPKLCGWGRLSKDKNGEMCRSTGEEFISNYLIDNNIHYEREIPYSNFLKIDRKYRCDWLVYKNNRPHLVEYFGIESKEEYNKKKYDKIQLINNNNKTIDGIFIYREDLNSGKLSELFKNCDLKGENENERKSR